MWRIYGSTAKKCYSTLGRMGVSHEATEVILGGHLANLIKSDKFFGRLEDHLERAYETRYLSKAEYLDWLGRSPLTHHNTINQYITNNSIVVLEREQSLLIHPVVSFVWEKPASGWAKLNFDGSYRVNTRDGSYGYIIRDEFGDCMYWQCKPLPLFKVISSYDAELIAFIEGLMKCQSLGIKKLVIEGDNLQVIEELRGLLLPSTMYEEDYSLISKILRSFEDYRVVHTLREGNAVADSLAREALLGGFYEIPKETLQLVIEDKQGMVRFRIKQDPLFSEVVAGSAPWLGKGLSSVCNFDLTPNQEECLQRLQNRINVAYDSSSPEHQEALRALWNAAFPEEELIGLVSEQWKHMGWKGKDPSADFRVVGVLPLENLLYFARNFPKPFQDLLPKRAGVRARWEYPFAAAGVNITLMLIQMLDLKAVKPRTMLGATFLKFLAENKSAFDLLYCITFKLMYHKRLHLQASYKDLKEVMKVTRRQLKKELLEEGITKLEDLPSYNLLKR